ncbi:MAG: aspartyl protease family protein, partial [Terracidiphilus sp.]
MAGRPNLFPYVRLCVLTCAASQAFVIAEQIPIPAHEASATVRFDLYGGYLIVAHGSVSGPAGALKNLNFLVDTGTTVPIFDAEVAQKLHLPPDASTNIVILGGRARGVNATLPSLEFGPIRQSNLPIITTDLSFFRRIVPVRIDAIVGLNVVGQIPFVIDYSAQVIRFGPPPSLAFSVPLKLDEGLATFDAEIDRAPVHLAFDTGVGSLVLFDPVLSTTIDAN